MRREFSNRAESERVIVKRYLNRSQARPKIAALMEQHPPGTRCTFIDALDRTQEGEILKWDWCQQIVVAFMVGFREAIPAEKVSVPV